MRRYIAALCCVAATLGAPIAAAHGLESFGPAVVDGLTLPEYRSTGPTTLKNATILGQAQILGPLDVEACYIEQLDLAGPLHASNYEGQSIKAMGPVALTDARIEQLSIAGSASFKDSSLVQVEVSGTEITIENSHVEKLVIKKIMGGAPTQQRVKLKGDSQVELLDFESGQGQVWVMSDASAVTTLNGGQLIMQQN